LDRQNPKRLEAKAKMSWTCPYCGQPQVISSKNSHSVDFAIYVGETTKGPSGLSVFAVACLNPGCKQLSLNLQMRARRNDEGYKLDLRKTTQVWQLLPESSARPQPEFIPKPLVDDYVEACRIRDLSPKASATLARRCLQGMIRDFCGIAKPTLFKEIEALREQLDAGTAAKGVTHESVDAIDSVRSVGNIGAHMEKDVDLIIEIDPGEAQMLIDLIEMLFEEWYIERDKRARRLAEITALSAQKASELANIMLAKLAEQNAGSTPGDTGPG
jgi:Domain of unknown function (DUF4145)